MSEGALLWTARDGKTTRWPGFDWRVLAHRSTKPGPRGTGVGEPIELSHKDFSEWTCFDELVIGGGEGSYPLIHVEQMNDRDWWIGIGDSTFALDVWRNPDGTIGVMVRDERGCGGSKVSVTYDGGPRG